MMDYIEFGKKVTPWIIGSLCSLLLAVVLNGVGLAVESWAVEEVTFRQYLVVQNEWIIVPVYKVRFGLVSVCNTTNNIDTQGNWNLETQCSAPSEINEAWIQLTQGLVVMGGLSALAAICCSIAFAIVTCKSEKNKSVVAGIIPTTFIAALFYLIAVCTVAVNMASRGGRVELSVVFICCSVILYIVAGFLAVADMQHLCIKKRPPIGKGLVRPI